MAEKAPKFEHAKNVETGHSAEKDSGHKIESRAEHQVEKAKLDIENIRDEIKKDAKSKEDIKVDQGSEKTPAEDLLVTKELKNEAYKRNLNRARKHLSGSSRALSKVIHQPAVDAVSKVGASTIARPTGILMGAIIALAGSSYLLYSAKHYGYQYNYLVVFLLLIGGYILGLIIESIFFVFRKARGHK